MHGARVFENPVDLDERYSHLRRDQQSGDSREQPDQQKAPAEKFNHACEISEVGRETHVIEGLHRLPRVPEEFRVAVADEDDSQGRPQKQQRERLEFFKALHSYSLLSFPIRGPAVARDSAGL